MNLKHASFFSGIGGAELAARQAGWRNVFHCEINPFCRKVLDHHFPESESYADIKTTDFRKWRNEINVLSGGFPCQPFSHAGLRKGTDDDRHLWPEYLRGIREIKPTWVVPENVSGFVSWSEGLVFDETCLSLENEGFEVMPVLLPAVGVNAPHERYRIWLVAYSASNRRERQRAEAQIKNGKSRSGETGIVERGSKGFCSDGLTTDTDTTRREKFDVPAVTKKAVLNSGVFDEISGYWRGFPTQYPVRSRNDGFPGRLDGITVSKWTTESLKAYGNAWVPQVAYQIFKVINLYELFYA